MYEKEMKIISKAMKERLEEKYEKHKDTWKTSRLSYLNSRITFLVNLYFDVNVVTIKDCQKKLVDIANQCMLLYLRLRDLK